MARTSSGGVSNSAAKQFSNCQGRITNDNYNRVVGNATVGAIMIDLKTENKFPVDRYPNLHPLNTSQVITQTGLRKF